MSQNILQASQSEVRLYSRPSNEVSQQTQRTKLVIASIINRLRANKINLDENIISLFSDD